MSREEIGLPHGGGGRRRSVRLFAVIGVVLMLSMPLFVVYDAWETDGLQAGDTVTLVFHNDGGVGGPESVETEVYETSSGYLRINDIDVENPVKEGYVFQMWTQYPDDPFVQSHEYGVYIDRTYHSTWGYLPPDSGSTIDFYAMYYTGDGTEDNPYSGCFAPNIESKGDIYNELDHEVYFEQGTYFYWQDAIYDVSPMWDVPGIGGDITSRAIGQFTQLGDYSDLYTVQLSIFIQPDFYLTIHVVPAKISLEFLSDPTSGTITYVS